MRILPISALALVTFAVAGAAIGCSSADPIGSPLAHPQGTGTGTQPAPTTTTTSTGTATATGTSTTPPPPPTTTDETWADGKQVTASVLVGAGVTITIAPGATVTVADGASITVQGTLKGASTAAHAKLTGAAWGGLAVGAGGSIQLSGVDLVNAATALAVHAGTAKYDNGTITAASAPFSVDKGATLTTSHANVVGTKGMSSVNGTFTASYLDYDSNGNEGVSIGDPSAVVSIDDSRFHGTSNGGGDMISASGAASLHMSHTEIQKSHCAFHFNNVTSFDLSFMTIHDNSYGFMLYGSGSAGTRTITTSNIFKNAAYGADEGSASVVNGLITIKDGYWALNGASAANNIRKTTNAITVTNMSTATPVASVGPR